MLEYILRLEEGHRGKKLIDSIDVSPFTFGVVFYTLYAGN